MMVTSRRAKPLAQRLRPPRLPPGATFGIAASSSPVLGPGTADRGVERLQAAGYHVRFLPHSRNRRGYVAGSAEGRVADLHAAFADRDIAAVLQLRGGYGAAQVLPLLDLDLLRAHPKPLIGMSDTTMLHVALVQAGLVTFWGPTLTGIGQASDYTWRRFLRTLANPPSQDPVEPGPEDPRVRTLVPGVAEGDLVGGTTSLLAAGLGTPWQVRTEGRILLLEEVGEEPYRVDRMLTQLVQAGVLGGAAGIVIGQHVGISPKSSFPGVTVGLEEILDEIVRPLDIPAVYGLPLGHGRHLATVPLGVPARLDADAGLLTILEPGVR